MIFYKGCGKAMAEAEVRRIPLERIKDKKQYEDHNANLEYCRSEHLWYTTTVNPLEEVANQLKKCLQRLDQVPRGSNPEKALLKDINVLQVKYAMLKEGTYEAALMENIQAETLLTKEFELSQKMSRVEYIKGLGSLNPEAMKLHEYRKLINDGIITTPQPMDRMPKSKLLLDFVNLYRESFVEVNVEELKEEVQQELGLVPYQEVEANNIVVEAGKRKLRKDVDKVTKAPEKDTGENELSAKRPAVAGEREKKNFEKEHNGNKNKEGDIGEREK